ncbi:prepilin peptidase [Corynebacterium sp. A21]|uniref:prepilin peptidase n=1 Tax=Corynebacterium sp. A21 TaxID=3457318 RepID=UPI003FD4202D
MIGEAAGAALFQGALIDTAAASMGAFWLLFVSWAVMLCHRDLRDRRLPDRLTLPAVAVASGLAVLLNPWAILAGAAWGGFLLLIGIFLGGVGGGDIKLAASLGTLVVLASGFAVLPWVMMGASVIALAIMLVTRRPSLPYGPAMLCAAVLGMVS